jgi:hypothetical protein
MIINKRGEDLLIIKVTKHTHRKAIDKNNGGTRPRYNSNYLKLFTTA